MNKFEVLMSAVNELMATQKCLSDEDVDLTLWEGIERAISKIQDILITLYTVTNDKQKGKYNEKKN